MLSNREAGMGRSDIQIEREDLECGMIIEIKRAKGRELLENSCKQAIDQIKSKGYAQSNCCFRKN